MKRKRTAMDAIYLAHRRQRRAQAEDEMREAGKVRPSDAPKDPYDLQGGRRIPAVRYDENDT